MTMQNGQCVGEGGKATASISGGEDSPQMDEDGGRPLQSRSVRHLRFKSLLLLPIQVVLAAVRLLLDLAVLVPALLFFSALAMQFFNDRYLVAYLPSVVWNNDRRAADRTYYDRPCFKEDLTTSTIRDLWIGPDDDAPSSAETILTHGAGVFQKPVLAERTARELRDWVLEKNAKLTRDEATFVLEPMQRRSFPFHPLDSPAVTRALSEITSHPQLVATIADLLGDEDPAILEMQFLTSYPGAYDQPYHADTRPYGSWLQFGETFLPHYGLFVPLQDVTEWMGPTELCPGSHLCVRVSGRYGHGMCYDGGFPVFTDLERSDNNTSSGVSARKGVWNAGKALLYNQQLHHRGGFYLAETTEQQSGPPRAMLVLTLAPRPRWQYDDAAARSPYVRPETRGISLGIPYTLRHDAWAFTWRDLAAKNRMRDFVKTWARRIQRFRMADVKQKKRKNARNEIFLRRFDWLNVLRSYGLWKMPGQNWGWDNLSVMTWRVANEQMGYEDYDLMETIGKWKEKRWLREMVAPHLLPERIPERDLEDDKETRRRGNERLLYHNGTAYGVWHAWAVEVLGKCRRFFGKAAGAAWIARVLLAVCVALIGWVTDVGPVATACDSRDGFGRNRRLGTFPWRFWAQLRRPLFLCLLALSLVAAIVLRVTTSPRGLSITSGRGMHFPFPASESLGALDEGLPYLTSTSLSPSILAKIRTDSQETEPTRDDVLLITRLWSGRSTVVRRHIERHPGNSRFRQAVALNADAYRACFFGLQCRRPAEANGPCIKDRGIVEAFEICLAREILQRVLEEATSGGAGRFLFQSASTGRWEVVTDAEGRTALVHQALLLASSSQVVRSLAGAVKSLESRCRYNMVWIGRGLARSCLSAAKGWNRSLFPLHSPLLKELWTDVEGCTTVQEKPQKPQNSISAPFRFETPGRTMASRGRPQPKLRLGISFGRRII